MKKFAGKVCVVTGGALGIGRCLTREFARKGAQVVFIDRLECRKPLSNKLLYCLHLENLTQIVF